MLPTGSIRCSSVYSEGEPPNFRALRKRIARPNFNIVSAAHSFLTRPEYAILDIFKPATRVRRIVSGYRF